MDSLAVCCLFTRSRSDNLSSSQILREDRATTTCYMCCIGVCISHPLTSGSSGSRLPLAGLLPAGQLPLPIGERCLPGGDLRHFLRELPLPLLELGLLLSDAGAAFLQLSEADREILLADEDGTQLRLQVLLLCRQGLLMAGGVNERQLHLITPAMELLLAHLEVALSSRPAGGQLAG